jgi:hypothetical protein
MPAVLLPVLTQAWKLDTARQAFLHTSKLAIHFHAALYTVCDTLRDEHTRIRTDLCLQPLQHCTSRARGCTLFDCHAIMAIVAATHNALVRLG